VCVYVYDLRDVYLNDFSVSFTAKTKGPIYVAFVSDEYSNPDEDVEKGYKIDYSSINNGC